MRFRRQLALTSAAGLAMIIGGSAPALAEGSEADSSAILRGMEVAAELENSEGSIEMQAAPLSEQDQSDLDAYATALTDPSRHETVITIDDDVGVASTPDGCYNRQATVTRSLEGATLYSVTTQTRTCFASGSATGESDFRGTPSYTAPAPGVTWEGLGRTDSELRPTAFQAIGGHNFSADIEGYEILTEELCANVIVAYAPDNNVPDVFGSEACTF